MYDHITGSGTHALPRVFGHAGEISDTDTGVMRPDDDNLSDLSDGHAGLEVMGSNTEVIRMGENATAEDYVRAKDVAGLVGLSLIARPTCTQDLVQPLSFRRLVAEIDTIDNASCLVCSY